MKRGRFATGFAAAGMMYNQAVTVFSGILIGRVVGAADYGIANVAKNLFQLAFIVAPLGLDLALQRYFSGDGKNEAHRRAVLARLRVLAFTIAIIPVFVLASGLGAWLETHIYQYRSFEAVLLVTFAALPFAADGAVTGGAYRGAREPGAAILATYVILPTTRVAITVVLFLFGLKLWAIVFATTAAQIISWLYIYGRARRDFGSRGEGITGAWQSGRNVLRYSWVMCVSLAVTAFTKSVDVLVLGHFRPSVEVGRYVAVQLLVSMLTIFSAALGQTLGSRVAERFDKSDMEGVAGLLNNNLRWISLVAAPLFALILMWGDRIDLILGQSFVVEWPVVALLALNQLLAAAFAFGGLALSMTGRQGREAIILSVGLVTALSLCMLLIPSLGATGAAIATFVGVGSTNILRIVVVWRTMRITIWRWSAVVPIAAALAIAFTAKLLVDSFFARDLVATMLAAGVTVGLYAVAAWIWLMEPAERQMLANYV